jgi:hypothetical protein
MEPSFLVAARIRKEIAPESEPLWTFSRPAAWAAWHDSKQFLIWMALAYHREDLIPKIESLQEEEPFA